MKIFKNYSTMAPGFMIMLVLLLVPFSESKGRIGGGLKELAMVTQMKAQAASDEASRAAEKQRTLVKSLAGPGSSGIGGAIGAKAADDNKEAQQSGRLTAHEVAREKAVLQQLEANARRSAEALESVKRLAAEVERKQAGLDGIQYLVATTQMKAQTASDEALHGAESQRKLVKQQEMLRVRGGRFDDNAGPVTSESGGLAAGDNQQRQPPGRLTAREIAREKAVLQQLEANARRSAEVLESVKRFAAEVDRQPRR